MKVLVFGSTGMIGTAIGEVCARKGIDCAGLSHRDIEATDEKALRKAMEDHSPTVVVNAVVMIGPPCEGDPQKAFSVNTTVAYYLAKICEEKGAILFQPSSHAVFDGTKEGYYTEKDVPRPMNIYSISKYSAELLVSNLCRKHYVVRFPTMFGPRRNQAPGFVDKVLTRVKNGEDLRIVTDKIDSLTYALDVAERLIWMAEEDVPYGTYHVANDGRVSYYDFVKALMGLLKADNKLSQAKASDFPASGHQSLKTAMKSERLPPMRDWKEALSDYVSTYLEPKTIEEVQK